jgi:signal transduction histidine kinase/HAMP domain-containing protein/ActR/RegA family two-component response regulator
VTISQDELDQTLLLGTLARVRSGDAGVRMPLEWTGVPGKIADTLNDILEANENLGAEVARVTQAVGKEGKLSQRVDLGGPDRVWAETVRSVNSLIDDLVSPTTDMQRVIGAVAGGDLSQKITADAHGEVLELKNTINSMVDQLNGFSSEVTRVAREVGVEGKLGGQAQSAEVGGVWKDLTDNVNRLAANLTNQVRAIADVATAVTEGDLTRQVGVEASGEVAVLKDKLNEMIRNLRETTRQNTEQDWLKTNLERFSRMLQGQRDLATVSSVILSELAPLVSAQHGVFYTLVGADDGGKPVLLYQAGYGYQERKHLATRFSLGEGLVGQCGLEKKRILLTEVPSDYVMINSGLGSSAPLNIIVLPVLFEGSVRAVIELASFSAFSPTHQAFLDQLVEIIGVVLNTIEVNTLTENLLKQSQSQAQELQARQEELSSSNEDLAKQAERLAEQNIEMERKNEEVERAKRLVEEKAEQLVVSSKYKSEFFSNMSHELRTPLTSLLMLAGELEDNPEQNLTERQVEYAQTIRSSGNDLLRLLNDVLDLAKVESGTVQLTVDELTLADFTVGIDREFRPVAEKRGLTFSMHLDPETPATISTDANRLGQVVKNLMSNALKFTEQGEVAVRVGVADRDRRSATDTLNRAATVVAITVSDTGIGIAEDKQQLVFEAFAQADGSANRKYGGTGLGLSITRELVQLLGGEITLDSTLGAGSVFTVYLPSAVPTDAAARPSGGAPIPAPGPTPTEVAEPPSTAVAADLAAGGDAATRDGEESATSVSGTDREPVAARAMLPATPPANPAGESLAGTSVLVIDDDFRNVFALSAMLERLNVEVLTASSGEQGIAVVQQNPGVDLVLVDIMMPGMDGYATMRAMRELPDLDDLPLVAFTAKVEAGERQRCIDAGASSYVSKPVDTKQLLAVLGEWIPLHAPREGALS